MVLEKSEAMEGLPILEKVGGGDGMRVLKPAPCILPGGRVSDEPFKQTTETEVANCVIRVGVWAGLANRTWALANAPSVCELR